MINGKLEKRHLPKDARKQLKGKCHIKQCKKAAEANLGMNSEDAKNYCWKHGFIAISFWVKQNMEKFRIGELLERMPDNCYKCSDLGFALDNSNYIITRLRMELEKARIVGAEDEFDEAMTFKPSQS